MERLSVESCYVYGSVVCVDTTSCLGQDVSSLQLGVVVGSGVDVEGELSAYGQHAVHYYAVGVALVDGSLHVYGLVYCNGGAEG